MHTLAHTRRHETHNALVPVGLVQTHARRQTCRILDGGNGRKRRILHIGLDLAPRPIDGVEFQRQSRGLISVISEQTANADRHVLKPTRGVETRPHGESEIARNAIAMTAARHIDERADAGHRRARSNALQPRMHEDPIVVIQWHDICHGAERVES